MNDCWHDCIGRSITDPRYSFMFITIEEPWLKQLRIQYMLGVEEPVLRLPGVLGKFKTNSEYRIRTALYPEGGGSFNIRIIAERIDEPGCEWQLRLIRRKY